MLVWGDSSERTRLKKQKRRQWLARRLELKNKAKTVLETKQTHKENRKSQHEVTLIETDHVRDNNVCPFGTERFKCFSQTRNSTPEQSKK
ncbi:hypothetical protein [Brevibacillus laterosporus]|uniref:hypothetical protein n=1 Tax=Brevibacillus laterosporus TaxID=1465 RepID=UPI002652E0DE|nr:hypothetical protein [Brevibacillus laterosporus]MDN9012871.1 hypothetical protein [Brevibacillus laterosporus]MDO0943985.1 hypothetical protein [Brevibacillus laterosporus]